MSFLSETIGRVLGRRREGGPSALRFNSWEAGGRGAGVFEKSAEALELERVNPLRGVDEWRLGQIFDDARDGVYADLAWLYNEIEGVEPALMACCETRESAAGELAWTVRTADADRARGFDQSLADEQRAALLAEFGAVADDIPDLAGHMVSAFFRGAAHALPLWDADGSLAGFRPLDLWNFAFDRGSGLWHWNADASRDEGSFVPIPPGELVSLAVSSSRHVDHAALPIFIRAALGAKRYGVWLDRFGIPPVGVIMPPNAERGEQGAYMDLARKFARGGSGILPNGSQVTYGSEARAVCPFPEFIRFQQQQIYAVGMGRVQSGENQGDNLGGNAAGVVDSALRRIVRRDARRIARAVNDCVTRKVLARLFPGRPALAQFAWDTEAKRTGREALEDAGLARNAGLAIDRGQLEEMTGYTLSDAPQPANPGGFGGFGGALNSQDARRGVAKPLQNARKGSAGEIPPQDPPARLDAILDDFSARLAEEMAEEMFSAAAAGLKDEGRRTEDEGGDPALNSECHAKNPADCRVHGTPREHRDKGFQDRYGNGNPEYLAANPEANIERGKAVFTRLARKQTGGEPHAMYREGLGWIGVEAGTAGNPKPYDGPNEKLKGRTFLGGSGIAHILAKHPGAEDYIAGTLQHGEMFRNFDNATGKPNERKITMIHGNNVAILSKHRDGRLLITDFFEDSPEKIEALKVLGPYHVRGENK